MTGYDTPEIRPRKNLENRDEIKKKAIESRDFLKSQVMNYPEQLVFIKCSCFDKYGRLLGELFKDNECTISINNLMVEKGYGYVYHGGKKEN